MRSHSIHAREGRIDLPEGFGIPWFLRSLERPLEDRRLQAVRFLEETGPVDRGDTASLSSEGLTDDGMMKSRMWAS